MRLGLAWPGLAYLRILSLYRHWLCLASDFLLLLRELCVCFFFFFLSLSPSPHSYEFSFLFRPFLGASISRESLKSNGCGRSYGRHASSICSSNSIAGAAFRLAIERMLPRGDSCNLVTTRKRDSVLNNILRIYQMCFLSISAIIFWRSYDESVVNSFYLRCRCWPPASWERSFRKGSERSCLNNRLF